MKKNLDSIIICALFLISRAIYWLAGIRFDDSTLNWFFQYLDPQQLRGDLLSSLYYMHIQPPLFNLYIGAVLNINHGLEPIIFSIIFLISGLLLAVMLYKLLLRFEIPKITSGIITVFFIVSPPVILYENWLFYTYPVTTLLIMMIFLVDKYLNTGRTIYLFMTINAAAIIVLIRTAFHPLWMVLCIIGLMIFRKKDIKRIILCSILPVLIIGSLMLKNGFLFKSFGLNSWSGMNIFKMTLTIPQAELERLVMKGEINDLALIPPFQGPDYYYRYANFDTITTIPVLDKKYKSSGYVNYNHIAFVSISRQYGGIAKKLILRYPQYYLYSVGKATYRFMMPSSDKIIFPGQNRRKISLWTNIYEKYLLGTFLADIWQTHFVNRFGQIRIVHFNFLYIYLLFFYIGMIWYMIKGRNRDNLDPNRSKLLYWIMFQVLYLTIVCNLVEFSENMRFRFIIIPYFYMGFAVLLKSIINKKAVFSQKKS